MCDDGGADELATFETMHNLDGIVPHEEPQKISLGRAGAPLARLRRHISGHGLEDVGKATIWAYRPIPSIRCACARTIAPEDEPVTSSVRLIGLLMRSAKLRP